MTFPSAFSPSRLTLGFFWELSWRGRISGGYREAAGS